MTLGPRYRVAFRRRREGKTNYHKRLGLMLSEKPRMVVRKSARNIIIQLVAQGHVGDITLASANALDLRKFGYQGATGNTPAAYLAGLLFGVKALEAGHTEGVFDLGLNANSRGSRIYAALTGAIESGFIVPHSADPLPAPERVAGEHIAAYARDNPTRFAQYSVDPKKLPEHVQLIKQTILEHNKAL